MNILAPICQPGQATSRSFRLCAQVLQQTTKRHQSSYRRSRQRLNIKPDASFLPSKTEPHDHIIFNPPPSMPNVYHTPAIFLPKSDRRHQLLNTLKASTAESHHMSAQSSELGPALNQLYQKKYHLTPKEMDEMRVLRREDPYKWTFSKLAEKYDCSKLFVGKVVEGLAKEKADVQRMVLQVVKSRWGAKRRIAREDREIRKERWNRGA